MRAQRPPQTAPRRATVPDPAAHEATLRARIAERPPGSATDWQQLGLLLAQTRRPAEAAEAFERAIAAGASPVALALPRALALSDAGRVEEAVEVARAAQARKPKEFALANLLGVMLKRAGRLAEAIPVLETARRLDPRNVSPLQNLGNVQDLLGQHREAAASYQAALKLAPRDAELWRLHGRVLRAAGDNEAALPSLERAFEFNPRSRETMKDLVGVLLDLGQPDRAAERLGRARQHLAEDPVAGPAMAVLEARLHLRAGRIEQARALLDQVLAAHPGEEAASLLLARLHGDADRKAANEVLSAALAANPGSASLMGNLVDSLNRSRYGDEGQHIEDAYQLGCRLLAEQPEQAKRHAKALRSTFQRCLDIARLEATGTLEELAPGWVRNNNLAALHYELGRVTTLEDRIRILEWHREWGQRESRAIRPVTPLARPALDTGRPIRVGFMSSDLRNHPVSYFALQLLELFDRDRFEVYCYSFYERQRDRVQAHIEQQVTGFRWWPRRPDAEVAAGIAEDGLDILFELGGSTAMNKLEVMAWRPARIGASWLGYPHSAGLEQIDYILVDPYIRPEDPRLLIERPFELPDTWVSLGDLGFHNVPIEPGLPEERRGYLTFGTMNNPYKYTTACLDAWCAVLRAVPGSRFLFVRPEGRTPSFVANARAAFAARDVDPDRLEFIGIRGDHLKHYNAIDIALESLPHTGGTTTCETLWMGVPAVAMVGPGFPERLSYSNLSNAGLGDLVARTEAEYVAIAAGLAEDRARRRTLREGMRAMIRAKPLGQVDRFVRAFYDKVAEVARQ